MAIIRFRYKGIINIEFEPVNLLFIRQKNSTENISIKYDNGSGQTINEGDILYSAGTIGNDGYLQIIASNDVTFYGSGFFDITVNHQSTATQVNQVITFPVFNSPVNIDIKYNSYPETQNVTIQKQNRQPHIFNHNDFIYSDFDNDSIKEIAIFGDVSGYQYDGVIYTEGGWITLFDLDLGLLQYNPLDQDAAYNKNNTYKVKDANGNISQVSSNLELIYAAMQCVNPILENVQFTSQFNFSLQWNYNGAYYGNSLTNIKVQYSIDSGVYNDYNQEVFTYPTTSGNIIINGIEWSIIKFRLVLFNRNCTNYSNEITIDIT